MRFHVEVNFFTLPLVAGLRQERADEPEEGGFVGKHSGHAGAPFQFLIDAFQSVGGAQAFLVRLRQAQNGQALRQIFFHPGGQLGRARGIPGYDFLEAAVGTGAIRAVENAADGGGDGGAFVQAGHIGLGVLLEMKLAALPGNGREDGGAGTKTNYRQRFTPAVR